MTDSVVDELSERLDHLTSEQFVKLAKKQDLGVINTNKRNIRKFLDDTPHINTENDCKFWRKYSPGINRTQYNKFSINLEAIERYVREVNMIKQDEGIVYFIRVNGEDRICWRI